MKPQTTQDAVPDFLAAEYDARDPNPWLALYLDNSTPLSEEVKRVWLLDSSSASRQYLLPFVRPLARLMIILIQILKIFVPKRWSASLTLHWLLATGLRYFVSPAANWLILRHFHLGSQTLAFIAANAPVKVECSPLQPLAIEDLKDELFLKHDLNLFNFRHSPQQGFAGRKRMLAAGGKTGLQHDCRSAAAAGRHAARLVQLHRPADGDRAVHAHLSAVPDRQRFLARVELAAAGRNHRSLHRKVVERAAASDPGEQQASAGAA